MDTGDITGQDVLNGVAEIRDEPLEDAVRLRGATYHQGITDAGGSALIANVPFGSYFWFVQPAAGDSEHRHDSVGTPSGTGCERRYVTIFQMASSAKIAP